MGKTIDFEWYKVFYEVALRGSVSGAAADLAVSQPAVSQSIRNLEDAFGVRLFHRRSRGVELTETGRRLYSYVRESYRLLKLGERTVREYLELSAGSLLIAAPDDLGTYHLTPIFKAFRSAHPEVILHTQTASSHEILLGIEEGRLETGFVSLPLETGALGIVPLMEVEDLFIAGEGYEHLEGRVLTPGELLTLPMAVPAAGSPARSCLEAYLKPPAGWVPALEASSSERIRRFAAAGLGAGFILKEALSGPLAGDGLFRLATDGKPEARRGAFLFRADVPLSPAARAMHDLVCTFMSA
jgi:DNA-binding transcriptional LysR family regulator